MQKLAIIRDDVSPMDSILANFECDNEKTGEYKMVEKAQECMNSECKCNKQKCCKNTSCKSRK